MANEIHGKAGDITVAGASVTGMKNWTLKFSQAASEVTNFGDSGAKRFLAGETGWSGSFTGTKTGAPLNIISLNASNSGAGAATVFKESPASTQQWSGNVILTDVTAKVDSKGVVEYSYSFTGNGALTLPTT
jgi:hypothetical protein